MYFDTEEQATKAELRDEIRKITHSIISKYKEHVDKESYKYGEYRSYSYSSVVQRGLDEAIGYILQNPKIIYDGITKLQLIAAATDAKEDDIILDELNATKPWWRIW